MKQFKFTLEKALKLREYHEKETKIDLGRAIGALTQIEQAINATTEQRSAAAAERFSIGLSVSDILTFDHYVQRLDATKVQLTREAEKASARVEDARGIYLEASRDRKVLSKVKEHREKEYHKAMLAEETKVLDDISSGSKARRLISTGPEPKPLV
ncbi:MAG: flagellar export protein FliJ [Treponema sp.]|jgi:flagellar FliJ protein|nr:flagellar export protein FliJ [Treponema sp.]